MEKKILLKIVSKLDELTRAIERGDIELENFREDLSDLYSEIESL